MPGGKKEKDLTKGGEKDSMLRREKVMRKRKRELQRQRERERERERAMARERVRASTLGIERDLVEGRKRMHPQGCIATKRRKKNDG